MVPRERQRKGRCFKRIYLAGYSSTIIYGHDELVQAKPILTICSYAMWIILYESLLQRAQATQIKRDWRTNPFPSTHNPFGSFNRGIGSYRYALRKAHSNELREMKNNLECNNPFHRATPRRLAGSSDLTIWGRVWRAKAILSKIFERVMCKYIRRNTGEGSSNSLEELRRSRIDYYLNRNYIQRRNQNFNYALHDN
ncbi:hypothetical protein V1477_001505 [Vespula maculifrons]|uniref:Uncharacterized protein n=1 Tax=Vespula maculifrons TaxID=7453 RepID=A0ABD2CYQ9_VESMC